jgi:hypothetical protein
VSQSAIVPEAPNVREVGFPELFVKTAIAHSITYMFMGVIAATAMNYREAFARPEVACYMRQLNDPWVMAGPLFQPLRGLIFALALYPLRSLLFGRKCGWAILWWLLVALGILGTFGPAAGSLEGMVYMTAKPLAQMMGYLEVVPQAFLLSVILCYWINHPKKWLNWTLGVMFFLIMALPVLGLLTRNYQPHRSSLSGWEQVQEPHRIGSTNSNSSLTQKEAFSGRHTLRA